VCSSDLLLEKQQQCKNYLTSLLSYGKADCQKINRNPDPNPSTLPCTNSRDHANANFLKWYQTSGFDSDMASTEPTMSLLTYGPSGAGKTTFIKKFIAHLITSNGSIQLKCFMTYFLAQKNLGLVQYVGNSCKTISLHRLRPPLETTSGSYFNPHTLVSNDDYQVLKSDQYDPYSEPYITCNDVKVIDDIINNAVYRRTKNNPTSSRSVLYFEIKVNGKTIYILDLFGNEQEEKYAHATVSGFKDSRPNIVGESLAINLFLTSIGKTLVNKKKNAISTTVETGNPNTFEEILIKDFRVKPDFQRKFKHFNNVFDSGRVHLVVLGISSSSIYVNENINIINDIENSKLTFDFIQELDCNRKCLFLDNKEDKAKIFETFGLKDDAETIKFLIKYPILHTLIGEEGEGRTRLFGFEDNSRSPSVAPPRSSGSEESDYGLFHDPNAYIGDRATPEHAASMPRITAEESKSSSQSPLGLGFGFGNLLPRYRRFSGGNRKKTRYIRTKSNHKKRRQTIKKKQRTKKRALKK
jgi:hypothetical protein